MPDTPQYHPVGTKVQTHPDENETNNMVRHPQLQNRKVGLVGYITHMPPQESRVEHSYCVRHIDGTIAFYFHKELEVLEGPKELPEITIEITTLKVHPMAGPDCEVSTIRVYTQEGQWQETYGCDEQMMAFIRGVKAGASMNKNYRLKLVKDGEPW